MSVAFHWTTQQSADELVTTQKPRPHFWVARNRDDYSGEVCLLVCLPMEIDWNEPEKSDWQRCFCTGLPSGAKIEYEIPAYKEAKG